MPTRPQESNYATWRLAKTNLAIRGIAAQIAQGDTVHDDLHPDLDAGYMLANPSSTTATGGGLCANEDGSTESLLRRASDLHDEVIDARP